MSEKQSPFLSPDDAGTGRRRSVNNPFGRRNSGSSQGSAGGGSSSGFGASLRRAFSGRRSRSRSKEDEAREYQQDQEQLAPAPPSYADTTGAYYPPPSSSFPSAYQTGAHPAPSVSSASTAEDPYAFVSSFDTVFLIDDSGSMSWGGSWEQTRSALEMIVPICTSHDEDGVDLFFLNHKTRESKDPVKGMAGTGYRGVRSAQAVEQIFNTVRPSAATPTGTRLNAILTPYLMQYVDLKNRTGDPTCMKPLNIIVITDGVPSDEVEGVLITAAKKLDNAEAPPYQVGVQFFQVGNEPGAAESLRQLDDELGRHVAGAHGIRDIVDTVTFDTSHGSDRHRLTGDGILKVVLGSVVKRLDRKPKAVRRDHY